MSIQHLDIPSELGLPVGTWRADPSEGTVAFAVKTLWGLAPVKGAFSEFGGKLEIAPGGGSAELTIDATSLDTANAKRDEHLRSPDFFNVAEHPNVSFVAREILPAADGVEIVGELVVAGSTIGLRLPVLVSRGENGRVRLRTETSVTREQAGMTWNRLGMIRGDASLTVDIELIPEDPAGADTTLNLAGATA
jgi:polyisoprenoid-binding protein YceI